MKTEQILNEREKTHGDFKTASETHYKAKELFRKPMQKNGVPLYRIEAIEAIIAKINRIAHGNHDHADHWDDIAGYAMLGKGGAKGVFEPDAERSKNIEQPKMADMPCDHPTKERKYFVDAADGLGTIMTVDYCYECNKMHIVDCEQKESENSASSQGEDYWRDIFINKIKDEFDFIGKRFDLMVDWLKNISENLVKLNESKKDSDVCCRCGCETNAYYELEKKIYCEDCFTLDDINKTENSTSSKMEHVGDEGHPMQPIVRDSLGRPRFKANNIIIYLLANGGIDMNAIQSLNFSRYAITDEDRMQLAQLLGYSIDGYGELSYVSEESYNKANEQAGYKT